MASSNDGSESYVVVTSEQQVSGQATPSNVSSSETGSSAQVQVPGVTGNAEPKPEDEVREALIDDAEVTSKKGNKRKEDNTEEDKQSEDEEDDDSDSQSDERDEEPVVVGMVCGTKDLYQKIDEWNQISWTTKYPDGPEEAAEDADTAKFALLVRNSRFLPGIQISSTTGVPDTC